MTPGQDDGRGIDEDAAWRAIIENYGERPSMATPPPAPRIEPVEDPEPLEGPTPWEDEGHFVPEDPPPLPHVERSRLMAWSGLVAGPVVLLIVVVAGWVPPPWLTTLFVLGFLAGFGYLVATMPRDRDDWSGDDGAVV